MGHAYSQNPAVDSMEMLLRKTNDVLVKIDTYHNLFFEYEFVDDIKAEEYLNKALELCKIYGDKKKLADTYNFFGYLAEDRSDFPEAIKNYNKSLEVFKVAGDRKGISIALNNLGVVFFTLGNYPEALKNHFESLKIKEAIAREHTADLADKKGIAASYNNIGIVYYHQANFNESLKNQLAALKIRQEINDKENIASTYHNIGNVYYSIKRFDDALNQYFAAMKLNQEIENKTWLSKNYDGIGVVYDEQKKYKEAIESYLFSLKIQEEIGDSAGIALSNVHIGSSYVEQKQFQQASTYFLKAKSIALSVGYKECLSDAYRGLSYTDSAKANFKGAFENHKMYILYRDSLDNEESRKQTIQSQMTYDFEKKEAVASAEHKKELENQEILAQEKSRKQKTILVFVVVGLFLVIVFAGFVFRSLKITRKQKLLIEQQKSVVEEQKLEVEMQKWMVEQHQKEIIDSITYARRIQQSLLPTERYIEKNMNRLRKI